MSLFTIQDWIGAAHLGGGQAEKEAEIITDYVGCIELAVFSVENLVRDLAPYIHADEDLVTVARGLQLLSRILGRLAVEPSRHTVKYLTDYLCSRLENTNRLPSFRAGIHEVASCLEVIISWKHFPPGESKTVASAIFSLSKESRFKDLKPAARQNLYLLIQTLLRSRGEALLKVSTIPPLVHGLVSIAEFEKTPICLGLLFQLYTYISKEWDLEAEEFQALWDSFSRYWPVKVGGLTQQVSNPTSDELRGMLLECMVSNDSYAKNSISMCLAKLDITGDLSATTKNEALTTLAACIESYSSPALEPWSIEIWNSLKFEIWNGDNDEFIKGSLKVLYSLSSRLSRNSNDWTSLESFLAIYVLTAAKECKERLQDSRKQFIRSTGMILSAIASGSPYAFQLVFKEVLPSMNTIWQGLRLGSEKALLLGVYNNLLVARLALPDISNPQATYPASSAALLAVDQQNMARLRTDFGKFSQNLVDVYFGAFLSSESAPGSSADPTLCVAAIKGLTLLFQIPDYLPTVEQGMIVQKLNALATDPGPSYDLERAVVESLQHISSIEPNIFRENTLVDFLQKLPDKISSDPQKSGHEIDVILGYLESLVEISCTVVCKKELATGPPILAASNFWHRNFDAMIEKLLEKYVEVSNGEQLLYATLIVASISTAIKRFDKAQEETRLTSQVPLSNDPAKGPYGYIILALFREIVVQKVDSNGQLYVGLKPSTFGEDLDILVRVIGNATMRAMRSKLTTPSKNPVLSWNREFPKEPSAIWSLFTHTGDGLLAATQMNLQQGPPDKCLANILSMSLLAGMQPKDTDDLRIPASDVAAAMINNSLNMPKDSSRVCLESTHEMLQILVNKFRATKASLENGTMLLDLMKTLVDDSKSGSTTQAAKVYQALAYFTAASLAAFDPTLQPLISLMIEGIKNPIHGRKVAQSFRILLANSSILAKENHCAVRLLRNSKCFAVAVNPLIELWQAATDKALKVKYLIAISGILVHLTPTQLDEAMPASRLLPVILEGIAVEDEPFSKTAFMEILLHLTPRHLPIIEEHFDSVLNRVLDRLHNTYYSPSDGTAQCRALAADVLVLLIKLANPALLLQRSMKISRELDLAKNDISVDVRERVGECSLQWFNLSDRSN